MATKNDLIEAQNFSRRRLLTAFVSGAPGGKELEPKSPMRAVFTGIALTVAVLLVGLFWGLLQPGLPNGWENGRLVLAKDTGARYVTVDGVLHPVINTASARLLIPSGDFDVISTDQKTLSELTLGSTLGIVGAPDSLPSSSNLLNDDWAACVSDDAGTAVRIGGTASAARTTGAVVVRNGGTLSVVSGDRRYAVDEAQSDAVLRAAGITSLDPVEVSAAWLNLFTPGVPLEPVVIADAGAPVAGTDLLVGEVLHFQGRPADERYVVQTDGTLAELSPLSWQLYQLSSGPSIDGETDVPQSAVASLDTAPTPAGGADWPADGFTSIDPTQRACALLTSGDGQSSTVLATQDEDVEAPTGVHVEEGHGALVEARGSGAQSGALLTLIDATGTAFALPGADDETVLRLGYTTDDVGTASAGWIALFGTGPALTTDAAGQTPGATTP